jgi:hypothetical protein
MSTQPSSGELPDRAPNRTQVGAPNRTQVGAPTRTKGQAAARTADGTPAPAIESAAARRRVVDPTGLSAISGPAQPAPPRSDRPTLPLRYADLAPRIEMAGPRRLARALDRVRRVAADALRQRMNTEIADLAGRIRRLHDTDTR